MLSGSQDKPIAFCGTRKGQRNACIAGCRLDNAAVSGQPIFTFKCFNHCNTNAVFDAGNRVEKFELGNKFASTAYSAVGAMADNGVLPIVSVIEL